MTGQNNFTNQDKVLERLKREYLKHGSIIVAYDFDNTIYDFHDQGLNMQGTIDTLRKAYALGMDMFCFTANSDHKLISLNISKLLKIPVDNQKINCSTLDYMFLGRKPYYSILLDDRAGLDSSLRTLNQFLFFVEKNQLTDSQ